MRGQLTTFRCPITPVVIAFAVGLGLCVIGGCGSGPARPRHQTPPNQAKMPAIHIEGMEVAKLGNDEAIYADASLLLVDKFNTVWIKNVATLREPPKVPCLERDGYSYLKIFKKDGLFYVVSYGKDAFKVEEIWACSDGSGYLCHVPNGEVGRDKKPRYDNVDLIPVAGLVVRPKVSVKDEDFGTLFQQGKKSPLEIAKE